MGHDTHKHPPHPFINILFQRRRSIQTVCIHRFGIIRPFLYGTRQRTHSIKYELQCDFYSLPKPNQRGGGERLRDEHGRVVDIFIREGSLSLSPGEGVAS